MKCSIIRELDEKDLLNKTYTQFLINISSAIKNCELFPLNDHARTELELLKKECKNQLQDKYNSGEPTIELLTEDELFYQCQERKSYHDYLDCYPFGVYSKKAKRARDMKENILVTILWIVLICFGGFMFYLFFIRGDWRQTLILMGAVFFASMLISLRKKLFRI